MSNPTYGKPYPLPLTHKSIQAGRFFARLWPGQIIDAIIPHMLLQWHHMISGRVPMNTIVGLQRNVVGDGVFSAGMWLVTVTGLGVLWRAIQRTPVVPLPTPALGKTTP